MTRTPSKRLAGWRRASASLGVGLTAVALMLLPVIHYGRGETATHARLHLTGSTVVMLIATTVAVLWRGPYGAFERRSRKALVYVLWFLAGSQLLEAAGALAWEADGETIRSQTLHVVHTVATISSGTAFIAAALTGAIAAAVIVRRLITNAFIRLQPDAKRTP